MKRFERKQAMLSGKEMCKNKKEKKRHFDDFTESEYRLLLQMARQRWTFIPYDRCRERGKFCLWRHDVDFSLHRALKTATIEDEEGVRSTYFIHLHSAFYHPLDPENADKIKMILAKGHDLGLHFDIQFYLDILTNVNPDRIDDRIMFFMNMEKELLEQMFECRIRSFSLHNPVFTGFKGIDEDEVGGMFNAYSRYLRDNYTYISDSNGYWRFQRLRDILESGIKDRLHVLTHPGWWTLSAMSPRERVTRCIEGRAESQHRFYDRLLAEAGRENVGKS